MEKISRILAPSARVMATEISDSQPARPGAPAFGRPMGKNSLGDRVTLSKQALESQLTGLPPQPEELKTYKNKSESSKLKMIEKLNQNFFNPKAEVRDGQGTTASEQAIKSIADAEILAPQDLKVPDTIQSSQE